MRISAGSLKGKALLAPEGLATRPTSDQARQAVFNILEHAQWSPGLHGAVVLDVFAGTGALGLEALSRGAARALFMETDRAALKALRDNIARCGMAAQADVLARDATTPGLAPAVAGLVFLDPPYHKGLIAKALEPLAGGGWIATGGLVVAEAARREPLSWPAGFEAVDTRAYGAAQIHFAIWNPPSAA